MRPRISNMSNDINQCYDSIHYLDVDLVRTGVEHIEWQGFRLCKYHHKQLRT